VNFKNTLKSTVAVAALYAVAAPVTVLAADDTLSSGNKNSLKISGQVVKAIWHADNGMASETFFTDGDWTASRIRWVASGKLNADTTVGGAIEMDIPISNPAASRTLGTHAEDGVVNGTDTADWGIRHQYVYVSNKKFGKVYLGQTSTAADGSSEANFAGTGIFALSDGDSYGSGVSFVNSATASAPANSTATVGATMNNMDHASRQDVIRYDSPTIEGIQVKADLQATGDYSFGVKYNEKYGEFKVRARAGYSDYAQTNATKNFTATGSLAIAHDSGMNFSLAGGKTNYAGYNDPGTNGADTFVTGDNHGDGLEDPHFVHVSAGYNAKMFAAGGTGFTMGYGQYNNTLLLNNHEDNEGTAFQLQAVQAFSAVGASVGIEYANYELESKTGTVENTFDDVDVISLMTVFKF
jgi:hypothetical protein